VDEAFVVGFVLAQGGLGPLHLLALPALADEQLAHPAEAVPE
jgi:hypothetical protein